jgi:hypothetical protein
MLDHGPSNQTHLPSNVARSLMHSSAYITLPNNSAVPKKPSNYITIATTHPTMPFVLTYLTVKSLGAH